MDRPLGSPRPPPLASLGSVSPEELLTGQPWTQDHGQGRAGPSGWLEAAPKGLFLRLPEE